MNLYHSSERAAKPDHIVVYLADGTVQGPMVRLEIPNTWTKDETVWNWMLGGLDD